MPLPRRLSLIYDASDRRDVKRLEKAARLAERQRHEVIQGIMSIAPGREWMLERLESCHVFASSYSGNALSMAFSEGERNVGLQLLNDIMSACPGRYVEMMQERNERDAARDSAKQRARPDGFEPDLGSDDLDGAAEGNGAD